MNLSDPDGRKAWKRRCMEMQGLMIEQKVKVDRMTSQMDRIMAELDKSRLGFTRTSRIRSILTETV